MQNTHNEGHLSHDDLQLIPVNKGKERNHKGHRARDRRKNAKLNLAKRGVPLYHKWVAFAQRENKSVPSIDVNLLHEIGVRSQKDRRAILFVQKIEGLDQMVKDDVNILTAYRRILKLE